MSETNKANTVAFHKKAVFEGDVETAFRMYAGAVYRQHNPLIGDGMEVLRTCQQQPAEATEPRLFVIIAEYLAIKPPKCSGGACRLADPRDVSIALRMALV